MRGSTTNRPAMDSQRDSLREPSAPGARVISRHRALNGRRSEAPTDASPSRRRPASARQPAAPIQPVPVVQKQPAAPIQPEPVVQKQPAAPIQPVPVVQKQPAAPIHPLQVIQKQPAAPIQPLPVAQEQPAARNRYCPPFFSPSPPPSGECSSGAISPLPSPFAPLALREPPRPL